MFEWSGEKSGPEIAIWWMSGIGEEKSLQGGNAEERSRGLRQHSRPISECKGHGRLTFIMCTQVQGKGQGFLCPGLAVSLC